MMLNKNGKIKMVNSMKGKEKLLYLLVILFIISTIFGIVGYILSKNNNETVEEVSFVGYYGTRVSVRKDNEEVSQYFDMLYLREDNTYYLSVGSYYNTYSSVGTYEISGDKIKLKDKVKYGENMCFYTSDLKEYDGRIVDKKNIILNVNNAEQVFLKNLGNEDKNTYYYITDPKEGMTSEGLNDTWKNCDE